MLSNSPLSSEAIVRLRTMASPFKKRKIICISLFFSFISILHSVSLQSSDLFKYHQVAMGTMIEIILMGDDEGSADQAVLQAFQEMKRIETLMSSWIDSSDVTRINRSAGKEWVKVSPETMKVIQKAKKISELSEGAFDITVGP